MEKVIYEKDLRLLANCEVIKDYDILQDIIFNNPNISKNELSEFPKEYTQFFDTIYPKILRLAYEEWTGALDKEIEQRKKDEQVVCDICNHDLEYVCHIVNKHNGKIMRIGRDCNKHFKILKDDVINEMFEKRRQLKRLEKIDKEHPYIEQTLLEWDEFYKKEDKYVFIKTREIFDEIKNLIVDLRDEYLNDKNIKIAREDEIIRVIHILLEKAEIEKAKIVEYIESSRNNLMIPTNKMVANLKSTDKSGTGIEWLEKEQVIKVGTLHRFRDEEFSKSLMPVYNELLEHRKIHIKSFNRNKNELGYNIVLNANKDVILFQKFTDLCYLCGMYVTGEMTFHEALEEIDEDRIIKTSELIDEYSIEYALGLMESKLKSELIVLEQYFHSFNDVFWKKLRKSDEEKSKFYYITKIDKIRDVLKDILFNYQNYSTRDMYDLLIMNSNEVSNSDADETIKYRNKN